MEAMPVVAIPLSGRYGKGKLTYVDGDYDGEYFAEYKWYVNPATGLAYRQDYDKNGKYVTIMLHNEVARPPKGMWIRHKDGNKLNNRSCNLEWMTPSVSALTRKQSVRTGQNNEFKFRGVAPLPPNSKGVVRWQASIKGTALGTFDTIEEAAHAYDKAAKIKYGTYATLNFTDA